MNKKLIIFVIVLIFIPTVIWFSIYLRDKYAEANNKKIDFSCITDADCEPRSDVNGCCPVDYCTNKNSIQEMRIWIKKPCVVLECMIYEVKSCTCVNNKCRVKVFVP